MRIKKSRVRRLGQVGLSLAIALAILPLARPTLLRLASSDRLVATSLALFYGSTEAHTPEKGAEGRYRLQLRQVHTRVDPRFLSVALDASQLAGGHFWSEDGRVELLVGTTRQAPFDFSRPGLGARARLLAPAYLRVGGTEADVVFYDMAPAPSERPLPPGYTLRLGRGQWDALQHFAAAAGLDMMFTANAGAGPRDEHGDWQADNLRDLLRYSAAQGHPLPVWELGNEVNAFWLTHGIRAHVGGARYAGDFSRFRSAVHGFYPEARLAGAAAFAWPVMGESPPRLVEPFLRHSPVPPDILTWHYYPQQSRRCWSATRRASPTRMLEPAYLDEFSDLSRHFLELAEARSPRVEVWLGETGGAQCGGEPGVSDRYASSLWWLDQLGQAAASGQPVVVRQTLVGSDYGLLDPQTLAPRPDYWASLLWKQLMGTEVLAVQPVPGNPHLRVYAHCHADGSGRVALLAVNLAQARSLKLRLADIGLAGGEWYGVTAADLQASTVRLNGHRLRWSELQAEPGESNAHESEADASDTRPVPTPFAGTPGASTGDGANALARVATGQLLQRWATHLPEREAALSIPARSYGFLVLPQRALACQSSSQAVFGSPAPPAAN